MGCKICIVQYPIVRVFSHHYPPYYCPLLLLARNCSACFYLHTPWLFVFSSLHERVLDDGVGLDHEKGHSLHNTHTTPFPHIPGSFLGLAEKPAGFISHWNFWNNLYLLSILSTGFLWTKLQKLKEKKLKTVTTQAKIGSKPKAPEIYQILQQNELKKLK